MATALKGDQPGSSDSETHAFTLVFSGVEELTDEVIGAVLKAGCDDGLLRMVDGQTYIDFEREAPTFRDAILSAIKAVEGCGVGITVEEVLPPKNADMKIINAILIARKADLTQDLSVLEKLPR